MRTRVAIIALLVALLISAGFIWRGAFAYPDHLAAFIPEGTAAYVHLNLTPNNRRAVYEKIKGSAPFIFNEAIRARDVREIAIAYVPNATPPLTLLIGQRDLNTPSIFADNDLLQKDNLAQVNVVRISGKRASMGAQINNRPTSHPYAFSAWLRPGFMTAATPSLPVASIAALFPEIITMDGVIDHRGLVLRSDARPWRAAPRKLFSLVRALQPGLIHIVGFPLRAFVEQIEISTMSGLATIVPETIDTAIDVVAEDIAVRFQPRALTTTDHAALRMLLARIWPSIERQTLDGERAEVAVAIPGNINIRQMGEGWWEGRHTQLQEPIFRAWRQADDIFATTSQSFGDIFFETKPSILISSRCDTGSTNRMFALGSVGHPQLTGLAWSIVLDYAVGNIAFCIHPMEQVINNSASLRENSFVDGVFSIPDYFAVSQ